MIDSIDGDDHSRFKHEPYICPNDRQLCLRAKLGTGWSMRTSRPRGRSRGGRPGGPYSESDAGELTSSEMSAITEVLSRAEKITRMEQRRIGKLVKMLEEMKMRTSVSLGDTVPSDCALCRERCAGLTGPSFCQRCTLSICSKCTVEIVIRRSCYTLCRVCSQHRETWKKSGAWFYKEIPSYILPEDSAAASLPHQDRSASSTGSASSAASAAGTIDESTGSQSSRAISPRVPPAAAESPTHLPSPVDSQIISRLAGSDHLFPPNGEEDISSAMSATEESAKYEDRGMIEFSVTYDAEAYTLQIALHKAIDLPPMDVNGLADPYVKIHLLPDTSKATKKRSSTKNVTLNPVYNEFFAYHGVTPEELQSKILRLSVFDEDVFGQNEFIGEARVELGNLKSRVTQRYELPLQKQLPFDMDDELGSDQVGKILIGILYMFRQQCLVVTIKRCSELKSCDNNGYSDPYVKVYLRPDTCKESKRKTSVIKKTLNPDFNEEFTYPNIKINELAAKTLEVTVWDNDFGMKNDYIGGLTLSMASKGEKLKHWLKMFKKPDIYYEQWHKLSKEPPTIVPVNVEGLFNNRYKNPGTATQQNSTGSSSSLPSPASPRPLPSPVTPRAKDRGEPHPF